jgi:hypothetical protein
MKATVGDAVRVLTDAVNPAPHYAVGLATSAGYGQPTFSLAAPAPPWRGDTRALESILSVARAHTARITLGLDLSEGLGERSAWSSLHPLLFGGLDGGHRPRLPQTAG